jgi:hypothetical protein
VTCLHVRHVAPHLVERLHHVLDVHVAKDDAQAVAALHLLDAVVHILWLQQVEPAAKHIVCEHLLFRGQCDMAVYTIATCTEALEARHDLRDKNRAQVPAPIW